MPDLKRVAPLTKVVAIQADAQAVLVEWPAVSVIIPHYQDLDNLDRCLALLDVQTFGRENFEIVVADNASPAGLDAVRAVAGDRARVVLSCEKGAGVTRNVGVEASHGRILAFVDSDCRPEPNFLVEGLRMLNEYDIVGGAVRIDVANPSHLTPSEAFEMVFAFHNERYIREKRFSVTAALLVSSKVFSEIGPFRNDVSEDLEWGNRATSMGRTLGFARDAVVGHPARRNWAELERKWRRLNAEAFELTRGKPLGRLRWVTRNWAVLASTAPHLAKIAVSRRLPRWSDRLAAMGVLIRLRVMRFIWAHEVALVREGGRR